MTLGDLAYWLDAVKERGEQVREQRERASGGSGRAEGDRNFEGCA
jgi:hypothetical protein